MTNKLKEDKMIKKREREGGKNKYNGIVKKKERKMLKLT